MAKQSVYFKPPVKFTLPEGSTATAENIIKAVDELRDRQDRYKQLHDYYIGDQPILYRQMESEAAKNNKLVNNFPSYIADIGADFLMGNPVDYQAPEDLDIDDLMKLYANQGMSDIDSDIALDAEIYGVAYDLTFANENSEPQTVQIDTRNTLMAYDDSVMHRELFAITCADEETKDRKKIGHITVYTPSEIITGKLDGDAWIEEKRTTHFFNEVPVTIYRNNKNATGSYEMVLGLVDAYNTLQSDRVNESEQLADAILMLKNFTLTDENAELLREKRLLTSVPADGDAKYLTKPLNENDSDILKKAIADDIHKFSKTPNLSDQNFVGNSSGVALSYKLLAFEEITKTRERHMEKGLKKRLRLYWNFKNRLALRKANGDINKVDVIFNRALPKNDYETSQMVNNLSGIIKPEILVKQLSFVDNAERALTPEAAAEDEPETAPETFPTVSAEEINADIEEKLAVEE